jgi:hypothetical protein
MNTNTMRNEKLDMKTIGIFVLAWMIPGMGHIIQKKYVKGVVFFTGIFLLLVSGVVMEGKFFDTSQLHPLMLLGFIGDFGNGLFYFAIKLLGLAKGNIEVVTYTYGTNYMACAGFLNYLIALNAVDIARGRRN